MTIKVGQIFDRWTVIDAVVGNKKVTCQCICGRMKEVYRTNLTTSKSKSCGCLTVEVNRERLKTMKHDNERLYKVYLGMKNRCYRKNVKSYKDYGARGIKVCAEWIESFDNFCKWSLSNGYKQGLTLDRIDVDGNYGPDNCRFVDRFVQGRNKRNNHLITINGKTKTVSEWAEISGVHRGTIESRIKYGWEESDLLNPTKGRGTNHIDSTRSDHKYQLRKDTKMLTIDGETKPLSEWSNINGLKQKTIWSRLASGCSGIDLIKPIKGKSK